MTILVTGGAGYIGSHMALRLVDEGEDVLVLDNLSKGLERLVPGAAKLVVGDVGDRALLDRLFREHSIEAVLHFAGSIVVPESVRDPLGYYQNNVVNSRELIAACVAHGVRNFIFSSTATVYGTPDEIPIPETTPLKAISPYGASKIMTEWMLGDTSAAHDFHHVIIRYFNVAGADEQGRSGQPGQEATHLIKLACQAALGARDKLTVFGTDYPTEDGTCLRDYVYIGDLIDAHYLALARLRQNKGSAVYNCGYGRGFSVYEVISALEKVLGRKLPKDVGPRREGDTPILVADSRKIRRELGWLPAHDDLEFIVRTAYEWERSLIENNGTPVRAAG